jgi:transcriptional regulator with XRE-family HTH domain
MLGERIKLARKKAGLTLQDLAGRMSPAVTPQALSKYERGKMFPSTSVLMGLGRALDVSIDFLMSGQVARLEEVEFRKHSGTSARERAQAEALVLARMEKYLEIEAILDVPECSPEWDQCTIESHEDIEAAAKGLRESWALGEDPIQSMTELLEHHGLRVIQAALPERFDGLTCVVKRTGGRADTHAIVVSCSTNVERMRFNFAHELAHRVIRGVAHDRIPHEKAMHRFAAAFLIPESSLREDVGGKRQAISFHEIVTLKHRYGVSAASMLYRLSDLDLLPASVVDYAWRTYARTWRTVEPLPISGDMGVAFYERPARFEQLVFRALSEDLISPPRAAGLLGWTLDRIEREIRGPAA